MAGNVSAKRAPLAAAQGPRETRHPKNEEEQPGTRLEHEHEQADPVKPRKKRRVVQSSDKKYECPTPECGKKYSRAEHLYRHQLNRMCKLSRVTLLP